MARATASTSARGAPVRARSTAAIRSQSASGRARRRASSVMLQDQLAPSTERQRGLAGHCEWWPLGDARPCYGLASLVLVVVALASCSPTPRVTFSERQAIEAQWRRDMADCDSHFVVAPVEECYRMVTDERNARLQGEPTEWEHIKDSLLQVRP